MIAIFLKKCTIPFFVFITGACVLVIEITATRILAPYFGNTIFSVSSVISVVLAALSLGYYVGGKIADRYPKEELFYGIIASSGFCVIVLHLLGMVFLSAFGYQLSIVKGPIISSVLLFFLQSFLLGTLSPLAIKLHAQRNPSLGIGSVSGQIFFWSTLGSIFGSLSAGFFLIPHVGINKIILSIGFLLVILGAGSLLKIRTFAKSALTVFLILCIPLFTGSFLSSIDVLESKSGLYVKDGLYQKIIIFDSLYQKQPTRFLSLDRDSSAAQFLNSDELAYNYTKYYALYEIFNPNIKESLMIGAGGYSVPKALLKDLPEANIDVAEIEPELLPLGKQYFNVPDDPRLKTVIEDGRRLLSQSDKKYDFIFSDAYASMYSTPSHLTTQEFFTTAKNKLNPNGIFMANVIGSLSRKRDSLALSEIKTFRLAFPNSYFFAVTSPSHLGLQNIIFVGYNSTNTIDFKSNQVKRNNNPIIAHASEKEVNIGEFDLSLYPILKDDYAPTDYLIAKELRYSPY